MNPRFSIRLAITMLGSFCLSSVGSSTPTMGAVATTEPSSSESTAEIGSLRVSVQLVQLDPSRVDRRTESPVQNACVAPAGHASDALPSSSAENRENPSEREVAETPAYELSVRETTGWQDGGLRVVSAGKNGVLEYAGMRIPLREGVVALPAGERADRADDAGIRVLMTPTIQVKPGRPAAITVGERVPYMVKRDDGSLVVKHSTEVLEGVEINLIIDEATEGLVSFRDLSIKISKVVGRQAIPDVPFDVGQPIVRSAAISTALRLGFEHVVAISLPSLAEGDQQILVLLAVEPAD